MDISLARGEDMEIEGHGVAYNMAEKPVTVAVISDTHLSRLDELPAGLLDILTRADAVVHLGDYQTPAFLNELKKLDNFYGVIGNHDRLIDRRELKRIEIIELAGKRLGLIHGLFLPAARQKRMNSLFKKYEVDILLYGHSHLSTQKMMEGVLLLNPGSVTGRFPANYASFGMLTLDGSISSEIIRLEGNRRRKWEFIFWLPGLMLRAGMRWLESWPEVDLVRAWRTVKNNFKKTYRSIWLLRVL